MGGTGIAPGSVCAYVSMCAVPGTQAEEATLAATKETIGRLQDAIDQIAASIERCCAGERELFEVVGPGPGSGPDSLGAWQGHGART